MFLLKEDFSDNNAIIIDNNKIIKYRELNSLISDFVRNLERNSLIFLLVSNNLESIIAYLSCLEFRIVPLLLNENINKKNLIRLIKIYNPRYVFSFEKNSIEGYQKIKSFQRSNIYQNKKISNTYINKDISLLLTTSGSTGSPKLVKLSKNNIISNAKSISNFLLLSKDDRSITSLPFSYSYGLSVINSHLYSGGSIVLSNNSMMEKTFWEDINRHSVTNIAGVPYNYEILLKFGIDKLKIETVKKMTLAGGKLNRDKIQMVNKALALKNIKFFVMYGQTEATARISYVPYDELENKIGSIGVAIPSGKLWLENSKGKKIEKPNSVGELIYKGPNVSLGYVDSVESLGVGDINLGIIRTGDLAYFDEEGYYFIEGKNNRYIKVFGNRVSLDSLEELISKEGYINAVTGIEDEIKIFLKDIKGLSLMNFKKKISEIIGVNSIAIKITMVNDFPRLTSGKIDYKNLEKYL